MLPSRSATITASSGALFAVWITTTSLQYYPRGKYLTPCVGHGIRWGICQSEALALRRPKETPTTEGRVKKNRSVLSWTSDKLNLDTVIDLVDAVTESTKEDKHILQLTLAVTQMVATLAAGGSTLTKGYRCTRIRFKPGEGEVYGGRKQQNRAGRRRKDRGEFMNIAR